MNRNLTRRRFLTQSTLATAAAFTPKAFAAPAPEPFTFLFFTDAHLQPELNGVLGTGQAFQHARRIKADFAINGGDHVFDANKVTLARATQLYDLFAKTEQDLGLKVHHTLGNHDVFAVASEAFTRPDDSAASKLYGKRLYEDRFDKTFYSFDHKGHHFIVLDTVQILPSGIYQGRVDPAQLQWLAADLAAQPAGAPIIVITHYPIVTAVAQYEPWKPSPDPKHWLALINSEEVLALLPGHNILGVLQGHTHVNEQVLWRGIPYLTSGAVSGNWWRGTRLGTPEGYTVVEVANNKLTTRYETYGFHSIDPNNT